MKKVIINAVIFFGFLVPQLIQAQGTIYLSNLSLSSVGSLAIGSDSWYASLFETGSNSSGYLLNSIQLAMMDASGNPNDFDVMVYTVVGFSGAEPGSSLGALDGSANPSTTGIYTYTDDSSIALSPNTQYFIVVTAGTSTATGAYEWSHAGTYSYNPVGGWVTFANAFYSNNGSSWSSGSSGDLQFTINASAIPEPSAWTLLLLGGGVFLYIRTRNIFPPIP